jgi:hypothetical protein
LGGYAGQIVEGPIRSERALGDAVHAFEEIRVTALYFQPTTASLDQVVGSQFPSL